MKSFLLPGLHQSASAPCKSDFFKFIEARKGLFPDMYAFMSDTDSFLNNKFPELNTYLNREKRLLIFETPNRVKVTHEYDYSTDGNVNKDELYYLFNPANRLNWLKIFIEKERVIVAKSTEVKKIITDKLDSEVEKLLKLKVADYSSEDEIKDILWECKLGFPCFIIFSNKPDRSFIVETEFFESIREEKNEETSSLCGFAKRLIYPFEERDIKYQYKPNTTLTAWLYCKAPKGFFITLENTKNDSFDLNDNKYILDEADPEVCFSSFQNKSNNLNDINIFNIKIEIPKSLLVWFSSIYYLSLIYLTILFLAITNKLYLEKYAPIFQIKGINEFITNQSFVTSFSLALIASIITTRSWLISEETILKNYSIKITWMLLLLFLLTIIYQII